MFIQRLLSIISLIMVSITIMGCDCSETGLSFLGGLIGFIFILIRNDRIAQERERQAQEWRRNAEEQAKRSRIKPELTPEVVDFILELYLDLGVELEIIPSYIYDSFGMEVSINLIENILELAANQSSSYDIDTDIVLELIDQLSFDHDEIGLNDEYEIGFSDDDFIIEDEGFDFDIDFDIDIDF